MTRYSSDSDSSTERSSSKKYKKKSKSRRRRSCSSSYDTGRSRDSRRNSPSRSSRSYSSEKERRSRSRDDRRRRRRSSSEDSRSRRSHRRSRSRSRTPRRYRSRSRTNSRDRENYSRGKYRNRSRSKSRDKSSKRKKRTKKGKEGSSPKAALKLKDEDVAGFADMTPAQQSRIRISNAFKSTECQDDKINKDKDPDTVLDHLERAQVIEDIQDDHFMPTHFTSSRSNKSKEVKTPSWQTNLIEQENFHEMAIFGNSNALSLDEKSRKEISDVTERLSAGKRSIKWEERDPRTLGHPNLNVTYEEAESRWFNHLNAMRSEKRMAIHSLTAITTRGKTK